MSTKIKFTMFEKQESMIFIYILPKTLCITFSMLLDLYCEIQTK